MKALYHIRLLLALALPIMLLSSGCVVHVQDDDPAPCYNGPAGAPGDAYFGIDWEVVAPDYLWTDNAAIPAVFQYGSYYYTGPGVYDLYYEGAFYEGCCLTEFYWDVTFDIWINAGSAPGPCGEAGFDGADSFLMLVLGPYGPGEERVNKTGDAGSKKIISKTDKEIVAEFANEHVTIRATYKKLDKSRKAELDQTGVKQGSKKK